MQSASLRRGVRKEVVIRRLRIKRLKDGDTTTSLMRLEKVLTRAAPIRRRSQTSTGGFRANESSLFPRSQGNALESGFGAPRVLDRTMPLQLKPRPVSASQMASHALPVYVAPSLLGDDAAAMFGLAAAATFDGRTRLALHDVERIGPALRILARLASAVWHTRITGEPWCWSRWPIARWHSAVSERRSH